MQADRRDRCLQLVRDGVDEAVMLLVAPDFAHKKDGIQDHASDDQRKEDDAEEQQHAFAPVEDDPSDVERDGQGDQTNAQAQKEDDRPASARNAHGVALILTRKKPTWGRTHWSVPRRRSQAVIANQKQKTRPRMAGPKMPPNT